jgi:hypothetical protein
MTDNGNSVDMWRRDAVAFRMVTSDDSTAESVATALSESYTHQFLVI